MQVLILESCSYRISSAVSLSLTGGSTVNLPRAVAQALIDRGDAIAVKPAAKPTRHKGE